MPQRKEPKEQVVYAASKRKPPPFKPLRPSKIPKNTAPQSRSSSSTSQALHKRPTSKPARRTTLPDSDDEEHGGEITNEKEDDSNEDIDDLTGVHSSKGSEAGFSDSEDLPDLPPASKLAPATGRSISTKPFKPPAAKRKAVREAPPPFVASIDSSAPLPTADAAPSPTSSDAVQSIPQPLLVRLLHEKFQDKSTQIDKHAIQVVQKYVEIFVREAVARTALVKREEAEKGVVNELEGKWLELEDLEKVAPGLMMDF